jgi:hypothetical protein
MNKAEIELLEGKALVRAFQRAVYPNTITGKSGTIVALEDDGEIVVLLDEGVAKPEVLVMSFAEQLVGAMYFLQNISSRFETTDDQESVYCAIGNTQSLGRDYFEAGMKAYLLFRSRKEQGQTT